jgi:hypothetical protein
MIMDVSDWTIRAGKARRAAHFALSRHESAPSRVVLLEDLAKALSGSPVDVQDYFSEAICCIENKLYRSSVVVGWAGFFNLFSVALYANHEAEIRAKRTNWTFNDLTELTETRTENDLLVVAKDVKFINNPTRRIYDGQLSTRNQCAHPTLYRPSMNEAIGFVDRMIRQSIPLLET